jgi:K+-sensing histidine kinase KdpD
MTRGSQSRFGTGFGGLAPMETLSVTGGALIILAALTAALLALQNFADIATVTITYLIAVLFAALRGGAIPAAVTTVAAIGGAAFFFYTPIYDFRVHNPIHLIDLALFVIAAAITAKLAIDVRKARMREQTDTLREALIGSVSHELRTPLSSIVGSASVLAQSPAIEADPRLSSLVQAMREEAERLDDHIQTLLDATRISSKGVHPRAQWVDPGDIVSTAIDHKRKMLASHTLQVEVPDDLPLVRTDPMMIEKALSRLIENAVKYSPAGSPIEVRIELAGREVRISVRDQGMGLAADELKKIWERFYRSPRHGETIAGSGLGLWIARALVIACGGRVEAFSAGVERGATLSIRLPVESHAGALPGEESDE